MLLSFCQTVVEAFKPILSKFRFGKYVQKSASGMIKSISGFLGSDALQKDTSATNDLSSFPRKTMSSSRLQSTMHINDIIQGKRKITELFDAYKMLNFVGDAFESVSVMFSPTMDEVVKLNGAQTLKETAASEKDAQVSQQVKSLEHSMLVAGFMHYDPKEQASKTFKPLNPISKKKVDNAGSMFVSSPSCTWFIKE